MVITPSRETVPVGVSPDALVRLTDIALEAGRDIMAVYEQSGPVWQKADASPLTEADLAAHRVIVAALTAWDPTVPVVSEEGAIPPPEARAGWTRFWLVDPLDGTKEFVQRNGQFTVNIALIDDGEPVLGVVHAPALGVVYYAGKGIGSWKRDGDNDPVRIRSRAPLPGHALRLAESRSHPSAALEALVATLNVAERVAIGSSLKFCWLAEGRVDVYPRLGPTMEWDVAAGDCIFRNSGDPERISSLRYNQPELKNDGFVLGLADSPIELRGARGLVVWFTGLSGSGKTTIARRVADAVKARGHDVEYLDGDTIRDVFPATGFSRTDRDTHIRRVGYVASRLEAHGVTVIASLVSPYAESRQFVRELCREFIEVYVSTPLEVCERRDVKGHYAKARRGEIAQFTGISDPYDPPRSPELTIDTTTLSIDEAVALVVDRMAAMLDRAKE